jgi:O-antigen/teichoic acid export membrane protein
VIKKINNIISWAGDTFQFDAHYFAKNTFWLLVGQAMASVASFLVAVVLANFVPKNVVGDFRLITSFYAVLVFFALSGLSSALIRAIVEGKDGALHVALQAKRKYGILALVAGIMLSLYFWVLKGNYVFGVSILVMSMCLLIIEAYSLYLPYLQGKYEFKYSSIQTGIIKVASGIAVIAVSFTVPETIYLVSAFYLIQVVVVYIQFYSLTKKFPPTNTTSDSDMVPYARHMTLAGVFYMLLGQADKLIVYKFFGPISLASYWIASAVPQEVGRVVVTALQVAYPRFVKGEHKDMKEVLAKKLLMLTGVLFVVSLLYALVAYPFFHIFFPQYVSEVSKSILLMFGFVIIPHMFIWQYYTAKRNVAVVYINNTLDPVLQVVLYVALIPFYGVWGIVYATLAKTLIMNVLAFYILKRY